MNTPWDAANEVLQLKMKFLIFVVKSSVPQMECHFSKIFGIGKLRGAFQSKKILSTLGQNPSFLSKSFKNPPDSIMLKLSRMLCRMSDRKCSWESYSQFFTRALCESTFCSSVGQVTGQRNIWLSSPNAIGITSNQSHRLSVRKAWYFWFPRDSWELSLSRYLVSVTSPKSRLDPR